MPPKGVKKYFVAIVIPSPVFEEAEAIKQELLQRHGLKGGLRSPAHITLHRPFEWREDKEQALIETLSNFKFVNEFNIDLKDFSFFEPRVIYIDVLPNEALQQLYEQFKLFAKRELRLLNEWEDLRGFHPHVTIANRDLKKPKFYELKREFEPRQFHGNFNCSGFQLLRLEKIWKPFRYFEFKSP